MLIGLIHRINARAERRVEKELIGTLTSVPGKRAIFTMMVNAALEHPDETVREVVYPVAPGAANTLRELARELMATERAAPERVRYRLQGSYSHYYRRCWRRCWQRWSPGVTTSPTRPVLDVIGLLARYASVDADQKFYAGHGTRLDVTRTA